MEKNIEFLYKYLNNASPTGFEHPGQQIWLDYIRPYIDETITDAYGSAVGVINPGKEYSVAIEAHADEIAWFVNYITPEGYIYVIRNGGSDHQIAPSMRVNLHTRKNGIVKGIFGWPAIHVRNRTKEAAPSLDNIFIDVGASNKEEVEKMGITVGTVATFEDGLTELNGKYYTGRALDNRMGGYVIAEVARKLKENNVELPFTLYIVNAVQEEIGLRGAEMISRRLKPNVAIVTDVTHDTQSPMYDKKKSGDTACGKGPALTYGPAVQNNLLHFIMDIAEEKNIPVQLQAASRSTGTDTDAFAYSAEGVPSALISLPLKYMHTTVETCSKEDIQSCIDLYYEVLTKMVSGQDFSYIK
ncbi:M42 family metallopeptidase [Jiulongibacter sediminis]|uniref:Peptidase M42 n=1 Tax=Jiulongibacter sediminis TaxID=1605367 RepID=A0A0P7BQX1_9BACT|nr:M42 family metallopeptidase [Jiulongibacter sediminis]KPM49623.1 peptidase M42 [Jiulongibacter sediminis]TBX26661.1 peptidase M42 [Jiulongibacter sediminis]